MNTSKDIINNKQQNKLLVTTQVNNLGHLPFDQKFQGEFLKISTGKWYSLFPVRKTIIVRLEFSMTFRFKSQI